MSPSATGGRKFALSASDPKASRHSEAKETMANAGVLAAEFFQGKGRLQQA